MSVRPTGKSQRPWNKGLLIGQKRPLEPKHVWSIRIRLEIAGSRRDLAIFNLAIDSKLRACDLCKAGIVGSFPHVNARSSEILDQWLAEMRAELETFAASHPDRPVGPLAVNLVVHRTNPRFAADLELVVKHRVPVVLTSLGHPGPVVEAVHGYGGVVLCDVTNAAHARKAAASGVDGLICVSAGAAGHASQQSGFSLVREIRTFWDGCLILGGAINDGWQVRATEALGADLAYVGTRFVASEESGASADYKAMLVGSEASDLVYTDRLSGIGCNFLRPSLERWGIDPDKLPPK